jgi:hypothetical protein
MIKAKLLMYGLSDDDDYFVDFYFNINEVQAYFMANEEEISIVLSGQIYELEYTAKLMSILKRHLDIINN